MRRVTKVMMRRRLRVLLETTSGRTVSARSAVSVGFVQAMDPIAVTKGYQGEILESELVVVCEQNIEKLVRLRSLWLRINPILINSLYATVCNIVFVQQ